MSKTVDTRCNFPTKQPYSDTEQKGDIVKLPDGAAALIGEASMGDEEPVLSA